MEEHENLEMQIKEALEAKGIKPEEEAKEVAQAEVLDTSKIEVEAVAAIDSSKMSETEKEAYNKGWRPDGPKSAEEFLRAEPLFDEIKARGKEIKELKAALEDMKDVLKRQEEYANSQREAGYKQALADLRQQQLDAVELGDIEEYQRIEKEIEDFRGKHEAPKQPQLSPEQQKLQQLTQNESVQAFLRKNESWIQEASLEATEMRENTRKLGAYLMDRGVPAEQMVQIIEAELQKHYPSRFQAKVKPSEPAVDVERAESVSTPKSRSQVTFKDLNKEQQKICRRLVSQGIFKDHQAFIDHHIKIHGSI